jgi:tight adherence protein B
VTPLAILGIYKWVGLSLFALGLGGWMFCALTDTKGRPYKMWSRYVVDIENQLKSMFMWQNAAYIATVQAIVALTLFSGWVFLGVDPLAYLAVVVIVAPSAIISSMVKARRSKIDEQVNGWALALANALKSTASIGDALNATLAVTPKPFLQELELSLKQVRLGSTIPEALLAMSARIQTKAVDIVVSALLIGRQSGGDLPTILERTAASLRELQRLEELTTKTLRGAKQSLALAALACGGTLIALPKIMPSIFSVYRTTVKGQLVAAQMGLVFCFALYLGWKFTRTDV